MHFIALVALLIQVMTALVLLMSWATSGAISPEMLAELKLHVALALHYVVLLTPGTLLLMMWQRLPFSAADQ